MLKSSLCDYGDTYILLKWTITITGAEGEGNAATRQTAREAGERYKEVVFKNCAPFTDCICTINNTQVDNAKDVDVLMLMYNLIEYSNNYSKNIRKVIAKLQR